MSSTGSLNTSSTVSIREYPTSKYFKYSSIPGYRTQNTASTAVFAVQYLQILRVLAVSRSTQSPKYSKYMKYPKYFLLLYFYSQVLGASVKLCHRPRNVCHRTICIGQFASDNLQRMSAAKNTQVTENERRGKTISFVGKESNRK